MYIDFLYEGSRVKTSKNGNLYADLFLREIDENGNPDIEQIKLRTFDENVAKRLANGEVERNTMARFDVTIRDATIEDFKAN